VFENVSTAPIYFVVMDSLFQCHLQLDTVQYASMVVMVMKI